MTYIYEDIKSIIEGRERDNDEDIEGALHSFNTNMRSLKGKGVDEAVINDFDKEVHMILNHPRIRKGRFFEDKKSNVRRRINEDKDATFTTSGLSLTIKQDG